MFFCAENFISVEAVVDSILVVGKFTDVLMMGDEGCAELESIAEDREAYIHQWLILS